MKKVLALSILWLLATFYIGYDHYKLQKEIKIQQEKIKFNIGFQDYLVYSKFLMGCLHPIKRDLCIKDIEKYYWECVESAYNEKKAFIERMKGKR